MTDLSLKYPLSEDREKILNFHNSTEPENVNIANSANLAIDLVVADESFILENKGMDEMIFEDKNDAKSDASNLEVKENINHNSSEEILSSAELMPITSDNRLTTKLNSSETKPSLTHNPEEVEVQNNLNGVKSMNETICVSSELQRESANDFAKDVSESNLKTSDVIPESNDSGTEISRNSLCKEAPKAIAIILRKPVIFICIFYYCQENLVVIFI